MDTTAIAAYARGWNDAALGRLPTRLDAAYLLGYTDNQR